MSPNCPNHPVCRTCNGCRTLEWKKRQPSVELSEEVDIRSIKFDFTSTYISIAGGEKQVGTKVFLDCRIKMKARNKNGSERSRES